MSIVFRFNYMTVSLFNHFDLQKFYMAKPKTLQNLMHLGHDLKKIYSS